MHTLAGFDMHTLAGLNILLGLVGFGWLLARTTTRWTEYPSEIRLLLMVTLSLFCALLGTSVSQYINGNGADWNTALISVVKVGVLIALAKTNGTLYRTGVRIPGNGDSINPNKDITASHEKPEDN